jgi:hypothetical protein
MKYIITIEDIDSIDNETQKEIAIRIISRVYDICRNFQIEEKVLINPSANRNCRIVREARPTDKFAIDTINLIERLKKN